jgi:hypothetical protein
MREHTFELTGEPRLKVQVPAGEVDIQTAPGTEAFVRLTPLDDDDAARETIERAVVEVHGDELVVAVRERRLGLGSTPRIRAEIRCPEGAHAKSHTASADVRARGALGDAEVHVASGEVELERIGGRLDVHSASGDVTVGDVAGQVDIHSASGDIELRRTDGRVNVRSASGDVALGDVGAGPVKLQTASGDVRIAVRADRRVAVDARTVSGNATSDIPLDEGGGEGADAPLVEIAVNGVSGDVRIERAAGATLGA